MAIRADRHHILFDRVSYSSRPELHALRETPQLIPRIDRRVHEHIHDTLHVVPLLPHAIARNVLRNFEPRTDHLSSIDALIRTIDCASRCPHADYMERTISGLVIEALEIQRPFIKEGLCTTS